MQTNRYLVEISRSFIWKVSLYTHNITGHSSSQHRLRSCCFFSFYPLFIRTSANKINLIARYILDGTCFKNSLHVEFLLVRAHVLHVQMASTLDRAIATRNTWFTYWIAECILFWKSGHLRSVIWFKNRDFLCNFHIGDPLGSFLRHRWIARPKWWGRSYLPFSCYTFNVCKNRGLF